MRMRHLVSLAILLAAPLATRTAEGSGRLVSSSTDGGQTWPTARLLDPRPGAYSCLAVLPDGTIGLLYEAGERGPYEHLVFARFPLEWLTEGQP